VVLASCVPKFKNDENSTVMYIYILLDDSMT
jgi:hypothetical protein